MDTRSSIQLVHNGLQERPVQASDGKAGPVVAQLMFIQAGKLFAVWQDSNKAAPVND